MRAIAFSDIVVGLGLVFFIEGLILAGAPGWLKRAMESAIGTPDSMLRIMGLVSAIAGLILIWVVRH